MKREVKTILQMKILFFLLLCILFGPDKSYGNFPEQHPVDVLIIGGGASGTMAGIQAARMGIKTMIVEETPWLGGMLTSAGVSAIDGNHRLPSGLWAEFREKLFGHYGGKDSVNTGWVSNVLFEPSTGAQILWKMAHEEQHLEVRIQTKLCKLRKIDNGWIALFTRDKDTLQVKASVVIDGTELGDVAKMAGVPYDIGMDSRFITGEAIAPEKAKDIIQDLTYVIVLKDYGEHADMTIPRPENYDPSLFYCTCSNEKCIEESNKQKLWDCSYMIQYGRLPGNKFMINWPINGNDYYVNTIEMSDEERTVAYERAKEHTRCYLYFLQAELGFKNLGIAREEFPSMDGFPLIPYHRESRRIKGKVRFTLNDLAMPFNQKTALYRTGIAVGDYPVDHHHAAYPDQSQIPEIHFYPVPSYCIPLGSLIPPDDENLIVAEKSISVTNIVNGTTRLQPVCMLIGQAAGILAALSVKKRVTPSEVAVREVQAHLLKAKAYILPYADVTPGDIYWESVQRIGATGIIKGEGKNEGWTNLTLFHPDSLMSSNVLLEGIKELIPSFRYNFRKPMVSLEEAIDVSLTMNSYLQNSTFDRENLSLATEKLIDEVNFEHLNPESFVSRCQMAAILDKLTDPFTRMEIDHFGHVIKN